ncbi:MAG TPA: DUF309 domain-containing protein [Leptolyngbyaceae cyanobacterium M65_K2018_010]|nr:DUF309 domain-containing protein [Leptolyngbyaceae cyanobacterium M65_K2018_010]
MSASGCPPPDLQQGIALFNQGRYYECHDCLEALWMEAEVVEKAFYQGILQIAVGFYHLGNHNWQGGTILLGEGVNRLRPFEPYYQGIAVDRLVDCGWAWLRALQQAGTQGVSTIAQALNSDPGAIPVDQRIAPAAILCHVDGQTLTLPAPFIFALARE